MSELDTAIPNKMILDSDAFKEQRDPFIRMKAIDFNSSNNARVSRSVSMNNDSYWRGAGQLEAEYVKIRNRIIDEGMSDAINSLQTPEEKNAVATSLNRGGEGYDLLSPQGQAVYDRAKNIAVKIRGNSLVKRPLGAGTITNNGLYALGDEKAGSATLGGFFMQKRMDGQWEAELDISGVEGKGKTVTLNPNLEQARTQNKIDIEQAQQDLIAAEASKTKAIASAEKALLPENMGAVVDLENGKIHEIEGKLKALNKRSETLNGTDEGATNFLLFEELAEKLKNDPAYDGRIGKGWLNAGAVGLQAASSFSESAAAVLQVGAIGGAEVAGRVGRAVIGGEAGERFLEETRAEGQQFAEDVETVKDINFGGIGVTRAQFQGGTWNNAGIALVTELPQLATSFGLGSVPGYLSRGGLRVFRNKTTKAAFEEASKATVKKFNNVALPTAIASFYGGAREAGGSWQDQMDFINTQMRGFDSFDDMRNRAALLMDEGDTKGADRLLERVSKGETAENTLGANMFVQFTAVGALEALPMGKLFHRAGRSADDVMASFVRRNIKQPNKFREKVFAMVDQAWAEAGTEGLQTAVGNAAAQQFYDENREVFDGVPESVAIGAILGAIGGRIAAKYNQQMNAEVFDKLQRDVDDAQTVELHAKGMVAQDPDNPDRLIFLDRQDVNESFGSMEEAAAFAPVRQKARTFQAVNDILTERGTSKEDIDSTIETLDLIFETTAEANNVDSEGVYEAVSFTDATLDQALLDKEVKVEVIGEIKPDAELSPQGATLAELGEIAGTGLDTETRDVTINEQVEVLDAPRYKPLQDIDLDSVLPEEAADLLTSDVFASEEEALTRLEEIQTKLADTETPESSRGTLEIEQNVIERILGIEPNSEAALEPEQAVLDAEAKHEASITAEEKTQAAQELKAAEKAARKVTAKGRDKLRTEREEAVKSRQAGRAEARKRKAAKRGEVLEQEGKRKGEKARGDIQLFEEQNRVLITAYKGGDASTMIEEMTHALQLLKNNDGDSLLDAVIGTDKAGQDFWAWATNKGKLERDSVESREKVAKGLEQFLQEGKAPIKELKPLFGRMGSIIRDIYEGIDERFQDELPRKASKVYNKLFRNPRVESLGRVNDANPGGNQIIPSAQQQEQRNIRRLGETPKQGVQEDFADQPILHNGAGQPEGTTVTDGRTFLDGVGPRAENKKKKIVRKSLLERAQNISTLPSHLKLPQTAAAIIARAQGVQDDIAFHLESVLNDASKALNEEYGRRLNPSKGIREKRAKSERMLNNYMIERDPAKKREILKQMLPKLRPIAQKMRAEIDDLSKTLIRAGVVTGDVAAVIQSNLGAYMHRSYEIFGNKRWAKQIRENMPVIEAAKAFFKNEMGATSAEAQNDMLDIYLNPKNFKKGPVEFFQKSGLPKKDLKILRQRKDIPEEIRNLWGEKKDPMANYSRSVLNLANLIASHQALTELKQDGLAEGYLSLPGSNTPGHNAKISKNENAAGEQIAGNNALAPLDGLRTTQKIKDALNLSYNPKSIDKQAWGAMAYQGLVMVNQIGKYTHTVLSVGTHMRNFMGGGVMYFGNGHADPYAIWKGMAASWQEVKRSGADTSMEEYMRKMVRLGVVDQNVTVSEMEDVLGIMDTSVDMNDFVNQYTKSLLKAGQGGFKQTVAKLAKIYRAGDTFWKVAAFESELKTLVRTKSDSATTEELEREASDRVRATMPTYSLAPEAVKSLSKFPLAGLFITFTSESIRITYGQMKLAAKDAATPGMRGVAAQRAAGLALSRGGALYGIGALLRGMNGLDEEDQEALRELAPFWFRNADIAYFGKNEKGNHMVGSIQFADPYSYPKQIANALADGKFKEAGVEALSPIFNTEFGFQTLMRVMDGQEELGLTTRDLSGSALRIGEAIVKDVFTPSTLRQMERLRESYDGSSGVPFEDYMAGFFLGITPIEIDPKEQFGWSASGAKDEIIQFNRTAASDMKEGKDPVNAIRNAASNRRAAIRDANLQYEAALKLGSTQDELFNIMKQHKLSSEQIDSIMWNKDSPIEINSFRAEDIERKNPGFIREAISDGQAIIRSGGRLISAEEIEATVENDR